MTFSDVPLGSYNVSSTQAPQGYENIQPTQIDVQGDQQFNVPFQQQAPQTGTIVVSTIDENGSELPNVCYNLSQFGQQCDGDDDDALMTQTDVPAGEYSIELVVPEGYQAVGSTQQQVTVQPGEDRHRPVPGPDRGAVHILGQHRDRRSRRQWSRWRLLPDRWRRAAVRRRFRWRNHVHRRSRPVTTTSRRRRRRKGTTRRRRNRSTFRAIKSSPSRTRRQRSSRPLPTPRKRRTNRPKSRRSPRSRPSRRPRASRSDLSRSIPTTTPFRAPATRSMADPSSATTTVTVW